MSHEHYPGCGHERYGIASDIWDILNGTKPQTEEMSRKNKEISEQGRESDKNDGRGGGEAF